MSKDQVHDLFKNFKTLVEGHTWVILKCIFLDNNYVYISLFDRYITQQGNRHQKTDLNSPQPNSLAERMNKTLVERIICFLSDAMLSDSFLEEALILLSML